jgi:hypothetical protein
MAVPLLRLLPVLLLPGPLVAPGPRRAAPLRPHIVMVLGDDVGTSDVGWHGQPPETTGLAAKTPTLDRLASHGVKLSSHYVRNWCAPTRAMILSGRYQLHYDTTGGGGVGHTNGLPLNFTLLPEALSRVGYTCSFLGKWHLGMSQVEQTPHRRGFGQSLGYFNGQEDYYQHTVSASWPDGNTSKAPLPGGMTKSCNPSGECKCGMVDLWQSDATGQGPAPLSLAGEYSMFFYARRAVQIIEAQATATASNSTQRMFLYFAAQLVHDPHQVPQRFVDLYPPTAGPGGCPSDAAASTAAAAKGPCDCCGRRVVLAMMSCLDEVVLNVTSALERTGLMSNSLFVFTSDNVLHRSCARSIWTEIYLCRAHLAAQHARSRH